ncbi:hypothetical protein QCD85_01380 [Paenibacillus sp. PsM32]|uniref:DUF6756 family protein n=1 Tax=Paenibacillus sp. PsM32 TaxID=3030536 RepID=UPI00263BD698|nr:DUF6756 family protein [Paenibacillus sp. PsM32]MDN4616730.1 hypothetical protein [Paenibacillus sp. PsM32]
MSGQHYASTRDEIEHLVQHYRIPAPRFHEVGKMQWSSILSIITQTFITSSHAGSESALMRGYNHLQEPYVSYQVGTEGYREIAKLIDRTEQVWFLAPERFYSGKQYWVYEAYVDAIQWIIEQTGMTEYYIVSKKLQWLLCETHHEVIIGTGEPISGRIQKRKKELDDV